MKNLRQVTLFIIEDKTTREGGGPAKVLGKEGQCVLIRHGGVFYWMLPCHLMKGNKELGSPRNEGNKELGSPRNEGK